MRWRVSLSYLELLKKKDTLFVDVIITPKRHRRAESQLQQRLEGILDRAFLRHESYRAAARDMDRRADNAKSRAWATRYRNEANALRAAGARTERRAAKEVRALEREFEVSYSASTEPTEQDIREAYAFALREGKQPPGYTVKVVKWWHNDEDIDEDDKRAGGVSDLNAMFAPLSGKGRTLVIGKEDETE